MTAGDQPRALGWEAIDAALFPNYGDREPKHYGTIIPAMLGGNDPLQGISVYKNLEPLPHFHYVTYGFSELYEKESENLDVSGYGFELTLRLACGPAEEDPPVWALNFLQNIARYVFSSGNVLAANHHIDLNGPIALGEATEICAIALTLDPQLGRIDTENGQVDFLQVVGPCKDEYLLIKDWSTASLIETLSERWPLLVTDLHRDSLLADPALAAELRAKADAEGSTQGETFVSVAQWDTEEGVLQITLGAIAARDVMRLLKSRLAHGEAFAIYGPEQGIVFRPDSASGWETEESLAVVSTSPTTRTAMLATLKAERGEYRWAELPDVVVRILPSEIKDQNGKVVQVIG